MAVKYGFSKNDRKTIDFYRSEIQNRITAYSISIQNNLGLDHDKVLEFLSKPMQFRGLLYDIQKNVFTLEFGEKQIYKTRTNIDLDNIDLLYDLFIEYMKLSSLFGQVGSTLNFCIMCNIDFRTFQAWENGTLRNPSGKRLYVNKDYINNTSKEINVTSKYNLFQSHKDLVFEFNKIIESSRLDMVSSTNSIGNIFLLKSVHSYRENDSITLNLEQGDTASRAEIEQRYKGASLPDKPSLDGIPTARDAEMCANDGHKDGSGQARQQDPK